MIAKSAYDSFSSFSNCLTLDLFTLVKWEFYDEMFMFENDRDR